MNTYFANCRTSEEVKTEYRRLCKERHPDLGKPEERDERTQKMQEINAAYALASAVFRQQEMRDNARMHNRPEPTEQDYSDAAAVDERIRQAIEKIITLDGIEIEVCGLWVWVSGDTKTHRDTFKAAGYRWAPKKERWYFAGVPGGGFRIYEMEEIRERYGSRHVVTPSKYAPAIAQAD